MVREHEADGADDIFVLVLDRHPRHDQRLAAKFHDIKQDRLAGLGDAAHQAVGDDLLDRAPKGFRDVVEPERVQIFFIDIDHAPGAIDRNRAFAQALQPLEQRFHGARADDLGIADDGLAIGHGVRTALQ